MSVLSLNNFPLSAVQFRPNDHQVISWRSVAESRIYSACLTSIIRTYYIWRIAESPDQSYFFAPFGQWSGVELSAGIIVGCFPVFPKFFQHVGPKTYKMLSRIRTCFATYKTGPSASGARDDPYARLHREPYTLNELEGPRLQAKKPATARVATRPDDLEHGDHRS